MASTGSFDEVWHAAAFHFEKNRPLLPMYLHLLVSALFPIYAGSHASLSRPLSAGKPKKKAKDDADEDDDEEDEDTEQRMEGLSNKDAIVFPLTAGVVLATLYFLIKKFGADPINLVLGVYFSLIGTYSVGKIIIDAWTTVESFVTPTYYVDQGKLWKVNNRERKVTAVDSNGTSTAQRSSPFAGLLGRLPLPEPLLSLAWSVRDLTKQKFKVKGYLKDNFDFSVVLTRHNVISSVLGASAIAYSILVDKPWWLTNLQGFAVSYGALQLMSPTTFITGSLILTGLFFYDIWAVFFTPLMVTVAKNLDVPIKLVFPRPDEPGATGEPPVRSFSMLGLGDIVLPGLMIALALRFDLFQFYLRKQTDVPNPKDEEDGVERSPYVSATGHWGDKFWTRGAASKSSLRGVLPEILTTSFPKPYFTASMVGYVFGMLATLVFMSVFQHAQPALLYLVPGVLSSLWGTGLVRGELKDMWRYSEGLTLEHIEEKDGDSKKTDKDKEDTRSFIRWFRDELLGTGKKSEKEKSKDGKKNDDTEIEAVKKEWEKKMKSSVTDDSVVFTFTITQHKYKAETAPSQMETKSSEKDGKTHGSSESISDDTVVVSSSDIDGSKDSQPRQRTVKDKKGTRAE